MSKPTPNPPAQQMVEMMRRCEHEIRALRAEIDRLKPQADAYQMLCKVLHFFPSAQRSEGYGVDLVWMLNKHASELEAQIAASKIAPDQPEDTGDTQ